MATFFEGVESITLLCSLVVILPAVVLVLAASTDRAWLVGGSLVGTACMMWARAGRLWNIESDGAARWLIGIVIASIFAVVFRLRRSRPPLSAALGVGAGGIAGWLWQPCVGEHFAEVLNRAEAERAVTLALMHAYVVGLFLPAILVVALPAAWPTATGMSHHRVTRRAALTAAIVYALTVGLGWYDDLVSELFRISSR